VVKGTSNPQFNYSRQVTWARVNEELLRAFEEGSAVFQVRDPIAAAFVHLQSPVASKWCMSSMKSHGNTVFFMYKISITFMYKISITNMFKDMSFFHANRYSDYSKAASQAPRLFRGESRPRRLSSMRWSSGRQPWRERTAGSSPPSAMCGAARLVLPPPLGMSLEFSPRSPPLSLPRPSSIPIPPAILPHASYLHAGSTALYIMMGDTVTSHFFFDKHKQAD
jgi:hypothetical protein